MTRIDGGGHGYPYESVPAGQPLGYRKKEPASPADNDEDSVSEVDAGEGGNMGDQRGQERGGYQQRPKYNPPGVGEIVDEEV